MVQILLLLVLVNDMIWLREYSCKLSTSWYDFDQVKVQSDYSHTFIFTIAYSKNKGLTLVRLVKVFIVSFRRLIALIGY